MNGYRYVCIERRTWESDEELIYAIVKDVETNAKYSINLKQCKVDLEELNADGREALVLSGDFIYEPPYGNKLIAETSSFPFNKEDTIKKLCEIDGVGESRATLIYNTFEPFTMERLIDNASIVRTIPNLSNDIKQNIINWINQHKHELRIVLPFLEYGFNNKQAQFLIKSHAYKDINEYKRYPYYILDYIDRLNLVEQQEAPKFNFKKIDELVIKNNINIDENTRIYYAIDYLFKKYLPKDMEYANGDTKFFYLNAVKILSRDIIPQINRTPNEFKQAIMNHEKLTHTIQNIEFEHEKLTKEENFIFNFITNNESYSYDLPDINQLTNINYTDSQKQAIEYAINYKISFLTGGPGTGKTTTVNGIAKAFYELFMKHQSKFNVDDTIEAAIYCFALTGRATKRLKESITSITNKSAYTLHQCIYNLQLATNIQKTNNPLIIVDESSMIDTHTLYLFLNKIPKHARVIFIGDADQLPPIGYGQVFKDCIKNKDKITMTRLGKTQRQGETSPIIKLCRDIKSKVHIPYKYENELKMIESNYATQDIVNFLIEKKLMLQPDESLYDIQIIAPYKKKKHKVSTDQLNQKLQSIINDSANNASDNDKYKHYNGITFVINDKVINTENNKYPLAGNDDEEHYVANGDIGYITNIYHEQFKKVKVTVQFEDESGPFKVVMNAKALEKLDLAYAITTHKAQGSEFNDLIIAVPEYHLPFLSRNLIYTAASRAKKNLYIYGPSIVFNQMVQTDIEDKSTSFKDKIEEM